MKIENTTRLSCTKICCMLESFPISDISGGIRKIFFTHLSPIFFVENLGQIREVPSVSFFRIKIQIKPFINKGVFCNLI